MQQNKASATILAEGIPTIPSMLPRDTWPRRSHREKQTKQNKTTYLIGRMVGLEVVAPSLTSKLCNRMRSG